MGHTKKKETNNIDTSRRINLFSNAENSNYVQLRLRSLSKFAFKCSVTQQRETVVLESMSFEALSCKGGASISICTSRASIKRVLVWHILRSTTVTMLPYIVTRGGTRLPIDSHIQHFILAT